MTTVFVTSSGTEVGKTYVSALLVRQFRARGLDARALKPIVSGLDKQSFPESDPAMLLAAMGDDVVYERASAVSRWRFRAPLSPDMAAAREGRHIPLDELIETCVTEAAATTDPLVIEGVGGLMVPLDSQHTVLDWMIALNARLPLAPVVVVGSYLGTISHTLTVLEVMRHHGLTPRGVVVSESLSSPVPLEETAETIARFARGIPVETIARGATALTAPDLTRLVR